MRDSKQIKELEVFRGLDQVGVLQRTDRGSKFSYLPEVLEACALRDPVGIAYGMPLRKQPYEVRGVNLDPFFAGLLPEGLRFRALAEHLKTSEDDLFSLLVAVGQNTVGDVWVKAPGKGDQVQVTSPDVERIREVSFVALIKDSLHGATDPASLAGVQPKVSSEMITIPLGPRAKRRSYILKLAPERYPRLIENELFFMKMAKGLKLPVAEVELVHDCTGVSGLLVQRFDRVPRRKDRHLPLEKVHLEDACQLLGRYPADKYRLSLREVAEALEVCSAPMVEQMKLIQLHALSYLIGNGDLHGKNISVQSRGGLVTLAPIYDLLSTLPYGDGDMALNMDGKDRRLKRKDFLAFGERIGVNPRAIRSMLDQLVRGIAPFVPEAKQIGLTERKTKHLARTMGERIAALGDG